LTKKVEKFHQLFKPQNLKQLKNCVLSKPQNWSKFGKFAKLSKPQTFKGLEISDFLL
jgi:hypothetical protein